MYFEPLRLSSRERYDAITAKYPTHSDFHLTGAFAWDWRDSGRFAIEGDALVLDVPSYHGGGRQISLLASSNAPELIAQVLDFARSEYGSAELPLIGDWMIPAVEADGRFEFEEDLANADYLLSTERLSSLRGRHFKGKAAKADVFEQTHEPLFAGLDFSDEESLAAIRRLFESWAEQTSHPPEDVEDESRAFDKLIKNAAALPLRGISVWVNQRLVAFTIYEVVRCLAGEICLGHFQKTDTSYYGATEAMMRNLGRTMMAEGVEEFNWEQDLGLPGLRQAKRAYLPVGYRRKFTVRISGSSPRD